MFYDITLWVIMSLILIIVVHYLFIFFKETLTVPKVKDLLQRPMENYRAIHSITSTINDIEGTTKIQDIDKNNNNIKNDDIKNDDMKNELKNDDMKNELKNFFNDLKKQNSLENPKTYFNNNIDSRLYSEIR